MTSSLLPRVSFVFAGLTVPAGAQSVPPVQWLPRAAAAEHPRRPGAAPWVALLATPTLAVGRYALAKGAADPQAPHARDEVYVVLAGSARLEAGGETRAVAPGDAVFVAARTPHRFVEIASDLDVLVFFANGRATTGGMAGAPRPTEQTAYAESSQRGNTRIFYWFGPSSAGQVAIDHGRPRWQAAFESFLQQPSGRRWRFGENFWSSLDTNIALQLGGVDVAPGQYYLALQHTAERGTELVLLDPTDVRARRLDAFEATKTTGGTPVPLQRTRSATSADELEVELAVDREVRDAGSLTIRFGPHVLSAPLVMRPHRQ